MGVAISPKTYRGAKRSVVTASIHLYVRSSCQQHLNDALSSRSDYRLQSSQINSTNNVNIGSVDHELLNNRLVVIVDGCL